MLGFAELQLQTQSFYIHFVDGEKGEKEAHQGSSGIKYSELLQFALNQFDF